MNHINNGNNGNNGNNVNVNDNDGNNDSIGCIMKARVLRFEFSDALIEHVAAFANVHQYDDRKTYKEEWAAWLTHDEIATLFKTEVARLSDLGYKGDIADKLFKSGRYYFRGKRPNNANASANANADKTKVMNRRKYISVSRPILDAMDEHIERGLRSGDTYTPANGFANFCNIHANDEVLNAEIANLAQRMMLMCNSDESQGQRMTKEAVDAKLKKTYKNRYFMLTKA